MRRWRFALVILSVAVVLAGAMGAAGSAQAQSDEELELMVLNELVIALTMPASTPTQSLLLSAMPRP